MNCFTSSKKGILTLVLFSILISSSIFAQGFQLVLDPVHPFQKGSLFNLTLMNSSNYSGQLQLKASLKSRRGKVLLVQETLQQINVGESKSIRGEGLQYQVIQSDAEFAQLYQQNGQLPPMNYVLCIDLRATGDQALQSQECIEYQAADFLNITPVYPPEEGEIGEQRPQFNWLNPVQGPYTYDFRLVKLKDGQQPNAAMRRNIPMISMDGLTNTQLLFPSDALPLENEAQYAWQVGINFNGEKVTQSEASTFTYRESIEYIDIPTELSYVDIGKVQAGATLYAVGEFKFKYSSDIETTLAIELFDIKNTEKEKLELEERAFSVEKGLNKYELDLKEQVYLRHLKDYVLIIKDQKTNNSFQLIVKYVNPDYIKKD